MIFHNIDFYFIYFWSKIQKVSTNWLILPVSFFLSFPFNLFIYWRNQAVTFKVTFGFLVIFLEVKRLRQSSLSILSRIMWGWLQIVFGGRNEAVKMVCWWELKIGHIWSYAISFCYIIFRKSNLEFFCHSWKF